MADADSPVTTSPTTVSMIAVEVVFALPDQQVVKQVELALGATVAEAIGASGLPGQFPQIDLAQMKVGIYGRIVALDTVLSDADRVEIYRPLLMDPKEARRRRAAR